MPSLSVALATFNGERYLVAQLESIAKQTFNPSEMVVADDGSSDATLSVVREFAQKAPFPVRIIQNQNRLGYRTNFMQAAAACTSELIAFCDQDDVWHANKLSVMQRIFEDPKVLLAYHNAILIDESGAGIGKTFYRRSAKTFAPLAIYPWTIIAGHAQVLRRSLLRLTPLHAGSIDPYSPDERMPHDQWYPFWASVLGHIAYVPEPLAHYRLHGANVSGWPIHVIAYIVDHIFNAEAYVGGNAIGAENRLELLQRCRDLLMPEEAALIDAAIPYYRKVGAQTRQRFAIYQGRTFRARAGALLALLKSGTYTRLASDDLRPDAFLLDAFIGVPFPWLGRKR